MASACLPTMIFTRWEIDGAKPIGTADIWGTRRNLPAGSTIARAPTLSLSISIRCSAKATACSLRTISWNRINEISFELVADAGDRRRGQLCRPGSSNTKACRRWRAEACADPQHLGRRVHERALTPTSRYNADWDFLDFSAGPRAGKCADDWLAEHFVKLGVESPRWMLKKYTSSVGSAAPIRRHVICAWPNPSVIR